MDGGAYCTLTPVVLSRGAIHAGGRTAARMSASGPGDRAPTRHRTGRSAVRRAADRVRRRDAPQPDRRATRRSRRSISGGGTSTARATRHRPARSCRTAWPAKRSSSARPRRAEFVRMREPDRDARRARRLGHDPRSVLRTEQGGGRPGIGLALAWHGAGFTVRARSSSRRSRRSSSPQRDACAS
jgi:hypothetical protein